MDYTEFRKFVEENTRAQGKFLEKATVYLLDKNASRKPAAKWPDSRIEKEANKMWDMNISGAFINVSEGIKNAENKPRFHNHEEQVSYWINFMNEYEFLENFTDGIDDMEFE